MRPDNAHATIATVAARSIDEKHHVESSRLMTRSESAVQGNWLLAIDASTEQASLALFNGAELAELSWPAGRNQTSAVLAEIDHLCDLAGCGIRDVSCIAVATGPGMFNGLRVGLSIAKGLSLASGAALIGVPTLAIAAYPFALAGKPIFAVAAAGRNRLLWGRFDLSRDGRSVSPIGGSVNGVLDELIATLSTLERGAIVTGEINAEQAGRLSGIPNVEVAPAPSHLRRAGSLAAIAWARWLTGDVDDAETLEPAYLLHAMTPI